MAITKRLSQSGMTMIELMVVLGIVGVVSAVLVFNYGSFRNRVSLRGLSQEIALAVRKAQTYATSVRSIDGGGGSTAAFPAYGISFSVTNPTSVNAATPSRSRFVMFADIADGSGNVDDRYNNGGTCTAVPTAGNECLESFAITSADRIVRLCTENGCITTGTIDIVFTRPAPDAVGCVVMGSTCSSDRPSYVDVVVQATSGTERVITVWNTGQISVQ